MLISDWSSDVCSSDFGAAIFLTFDGTAVAGEKAFLLHRAAQRRFIFGERLADAMLDGARLTRKTAALHGADHVILASTISHVERLVDDETQRGTCEIDGLITAIDSDLDRKSVVEGKSVSGRVDIGGRRN